MFSNSLRLILIIISLLFGIYQFSKGEIFLPFLSATAVLLLIYGYFRYNNVRSASLHLKNGENSKAEYLINSVKYPNLLSKEQKAYYFFIKAVLEQNKNNLDEAEIFYIQAIEQGFRTSNDEAIANLNLAYIYREKNMIDFAKSRLQKTIEIPHKEEVDKEIQKLKLELGL
jgi:tetratricopeptide (TPR) repeat protein